jgi:hypothetical protein
LKLKNIHRLNTYLAKIQVITKEISPNDLESAKIT